MFHVGSSRRNNQTRSIQFDFHRNDACSQQRRGIIARTCGFSLNLHCFSNDTSPEIQIRKKTSQDGNKVPNEMGQSRQRFFACTQCIDCLLPSRDSRLLTFVFILFFSCFVFLVVNLETQWRERTLKCHVYTVATFHLVCTDCFLSDFHN